MPTLRDDTVTITERAHDLLAQLYGGISWHTRSQNLCEKALQAANDAGYQKGRVDVLHMAIEYFERGLPGADDIQVWHLQRTIDNLKEMQHAIKEKQ